jgi:hypothetical protein
MLVSPWSAISAEEFNKRDNFTKPFADALGLIMADARNASSFVTKADRSSGGVMALTL